MGTGGKPQSIYRGVVGSKIGKLIVAVAVIVEIVRTVIVVVAGEAVVATALPFVRVAVSGVGVLVVVAASAIVGGWGGVIVIVRWRGIVVSFCRCELQGRGKQQTVDDHPS